MVPLLGRPLEYCFHVVNGGKDAEEESGVDDDESNLAERTVKVQACQSYILQVIAHAVIALFRYVEENA